MRPGFALDRASVGASASCPVEARIATAPSVGTRSVGPRIFDTPLDLGADDCFLRLHGFGSGEVFLKVEGLNVAGSVKLRPAVRMVQALEDEGRIRPGSHHIVESSSGNLGVALAIVCKVKGYAFTCVTDPNANPTAVRLMRAYGADVRVIHEKDTADGYLGSRIAFIRQLQQDNPRMVWTNQYANTENVAAHLGTTAPVISRAFPELDYLFVGAGTTGTFIGCAQYFALHSPRTRVIAVDTVGSVTFGTPPAPRVIPGLGTSRRPEIADLHRPDAVVHVREQDAVLCCRRLLDEHGLLAGGSTGSVLAAVETYGIPLGSTVVAVSPDLGDRYLDTIYDDAWVGEHFGPTGSVDSSGSRQSHESARPANGLPPEPAPKEATA